MFAAGSVGLWRAVGPDRTSGPPTTTELRAADPALAARPVIASGTLDDLVASLQARIAEQPDDWRSLASLGLAYVQEARITADPSHYPKAEGVLQRSLDLDDDQNFQALIGMGALALARHDFAAGLEWGRRAAGVNPSNAAVYGVMGDALIELGRYDEAFTTIQTMVDTTPDLSSYARAAYAHELQGDIDDAERIMQLALQAAPTLVDSAWVLNQLGDLAFNHGDLAAAREHYRRALAADPSFVPPAAGLARVDAADGRFDRAIEGYLAVVARYPSPEYVVALIDLYTVTGRNEDAEREIDLLHAEEQLFEANGVNVDLEVALFSADHGVDLTDGLRAAEAEWARRQSIQVADALAWQLHANGRDTEALRYAHRALALGTRNASFLYHRAVIEHALGRRDAARADLAEALDINPSFSIVWSALAADLLASLGGAP
jgi:tetratricopeptide (TPR) repeat protein